MYTTLATETVLQQTVEILKTEHMIAATVRTTTQTTVLTQTVRHAHQRLHVALIKITIVLEHEITILQPAHVTTKMQQAIAMQTGAAAITILAVQQITKEVAVQPMFAATVTQTATVRQIALEAITIVMCAAAIIITTQELVLHQQIRKHAQQVPKMYAVIATQAIALLPVAAKQAKVAHRRTITIRAAAAVMQANRVEAQQQIPVDNDNLGLCFERW